jgi:hypothetical protein
MDILTSDDIDKFLDKFQDHTAEAERVQAAYETCREDLRPEFLKRLMMRCYRYGKEHGYASAIDVIRRYPR